MMRQRSLQLLKVISQTIFCRVINSICSCIGITYLLLNSAWCFAPALTLTTPGHYTLGEDITFSPGAADSIISILSSDVTLDLGGWSIIQGNATAGVNGISVASGLQRVTIKNGTIRNVTGNGIFINSAVFSSEIVISDLVFDSCQTSGISTGVSPIQCLIERCSFIECILPATGTSLIFLSAINSVVRNIIIENSSTATGNKSLLELTTARCLIENVTVNSFATTGIVTGVSSSSVLSNCIFNTINFNFLNGTNGVNCFSHSGGSTIFLNCRCSGALSVGNVNFFSTTSATSNLYIGCIATGLRSTGGNASGFNITGSSADSFIDCIVHLASASSAASVTCSPYLLTNCSQCELIRCYALNNTSPSGTNSMSAFTISGTGGLCVLRDCIAANNTASGLVRGYFLDGATTQSTLDNNAAYYNIGVAGSVGFTLGNSINAFLRNVAIRNGTVLANQFAAFPTTQRNVQNINATNSLTQAWTNVGLI